MVGRKGLPAQDRMTTVVLSLAGWQLNPSMAENDLLTWESQPPTCNSFIFLQKATAGLPGSGNDRVIIAYFDTPNIVMGEDREVLCGGPETCLYCNYPSPAIQKHTQHKPSMAGGCQTGGEWILLGVQDTWAGKGLRPRYLRRQWRHLLELPMATGFSSWRNIKPRAEVGWL